MLSVVNCVAVAIGPLPVPCVVMRAQAVDTLEGPSWVKEAFGPRQVVAG